MVLVVELMVMPPWRRAGRTVERTKRTRPNASGKSSIQWASSSGVCPRRRADLGSTLRRHDHRWAGEQLRRQRPGVLEILPGEGDVGQERGEDAVGAVDVFADLGRSVDVQLDATRRFASDR